MTPVQKQLSTVEALREQLLEAVAAEDTPHLGNRVKNIISAEVRLEELRLDSGVYRTAESYSQFLSDVAEYGAECLRRLRIGDTNPPAAPRIEAGSVDGISHNEHAKRLDSDLTALQALFDELNDSGDSRRAATVAKHITLLSNAVKRFVRSAKTYSLAEPVDQSLIAQLSLAVAGSWSVDEWKTEFASAAPSDIHDALIVSVLSTRSEWCAQFVKIDGEQIDFDSFPWVVEPLNSNAKRIAVKKGAQIGFSIIAICRALYDCIVEGKSVLIVEPTDRDAKDFQKRIAAIIADLPESLQPIKTREGLIQFRRGANLYVRGSGGRTSIRSVPVDTVIVDEVSAVQTLKLSQAMSRLDASKEKTFMAISTPDYPGRGISTLYLEGDQRLWLVECFKCGESKPVTWEDFVVYADSPDRSFARCPACKVPRPNDKSTWRGRWMPSSDARPGIESYHVSQLVSHRVSSQEIAEAAIASHRHPELFRNFTNEKLGLDYIPNDANRLHLWQVRACVRPYANTALIPADSRRMHVLGLDQGVRNSFVVMRFDFPQSNTQPLDVAEGIVAAVGTAAEGDWDAIEQLQRDWQTWVTVIDFAGSSKVSAQEFARKSPFRTFLCQYLENPEIAEFREAEQPSGFVLLKTNRTWALASAHQRIKQKRIAIPSDCPETYYQQLTNEVLEASGKRYVKTGDDHWLHGHAYCEIGLRLGLKYYGSSITRYRKNG